MKMRRLTLSLTVVALAALGFASPVLAAPGNLDPSFGSGGKVTTNFADQHDVAKDVAIQEDGKIVVAGGVGESNIEFGLARYNPNGSLDATFDTDGKVTTVIDPVYEHDRAHAVAIQPDGKIVVAGTSAKQSFALARYNPDGSLDATFDTDGKLTTNIFVPPHDGIQPLEEANDVVIQDDGKIVVAGYAKNHATFKTEFVLVRYNADGSLDTNSDADPDTHFDTDGKVTTTTRGDGYGEGRAYALAIQPDGKIVVAGSHTFYGTGTRFWLMRHNPDGSLDTTVEGSGRFGWGDSSSRYPDGLGAATALAFQPDGGIIVAGGGNYPGGTLVRFTSDGSLDCEFARTSQYRECLVSTDLVMSPSASNGPQGPGLAVQQDGKIVVAGRDTSATNTNSSDFGIERYSADGFLDTNADADPDIHFDTDGKARTDFDRGPDVPHALAIQPDGRIVVAGASYADGLQNYRFALTRYFGGDDSTAPGTSLLPSGPTGFVRSTSASFEFSSPEPGAGFQCSLDDGPYHTCVSPKSYPTLTNGSHTFRVRATDSNGNADPTPASRTWTVDTVAPSGTVLINAGASSTQSRTVTLKLSAGDPAPASRVAQMRFRNENTTTWSSWQSYATSKSWTLSSGAGTKVVYVQYQDRAGNISAAAKDSISYRP